MVRSGNLQRGLGGRYPELPNFVEAHKDEIERGLYYRLADLFNLDVELGVL